MGTCRDGRQAAAVSCSCASPHTPPPLVALDASCAEGRCGTCRGCWRPGRAGGRPCLRHSVALRLCGMRRTLLAAKGHQSPHSWRPVCAMDLLACIPGCHAARRCDLRAKSKATRQAGAHLMGRRLRAPSVHCCPHRRLRCCPAAGLHGLAGSPAPPLAQAQAVRARSRHSPLVVCTAAERMEQRAARLVN